jgi:molecular chaperone GrpE
MEEKLEPKPEKKEKEAGQGAENSNEKDRVQPQAEEKVKGLKEKLKKREAETKSLKHEMGELKDKYLRTLAEMENLRKRVEREKTEFYQYALSEFLKELFAVLDNFETALGSHDEGDGKSFREGIELIYKQVLDLLLKQGVTPVEAKGKKFDPSLHQAFITEESEDVSEPVVAEELRKGYTLYSRVLRPTLVKVCVPKKGK